jgi:signal transduction histidine kinase
LASGTTVVIMQAVSSQWRRRYLDRYGGPLGDVVQAGIGVWIVLFVGYTTVHLAAMLLSALCAALLLVRRRYPVPVLLAAAVLSTLAIAVDRPPDGLFIVAGMLTYATALYSPRRQPWFFAFIMWGSIMLAGSLAYFTDWWNTEQLTPFAIIAGSAAWGDSVRMRRAYLAEVTERARQAELSRDEEARRRVMDERLRIARELHDVVAHHIAVISVHAGAADHVLRNEPEKVWPVLGHIRTAADTVLDEIKSVVGVLRDPNDVRSTEPAPGVERVGELLTGLRAIGFAVRHQQRGEPRPLPAVVNLAAYRIAQEALTNAHRYGDGGATLELEYAADTVSIDVTNRIAGHSGRPGSGFGLLGMRERATAARGTIEAGPIAGGLFRVHAELPTDDRAINRLNTFAAAERL